MRSTILIWMVSLALGVQGQESPDSYGIEGDSYPPGLEVGTAAQEVELIDQNGQPFVLSETLKEGPVVLIFYRGNWCPHCSRYLSQIVENIQQFENAGARIVAISPEAEAAIQQTDENLTRGRITLLPDHGSQVMKAWRLAFGVTEGYQTKIKQNLATDIAEHNNQKAAVLPVPATYVIETDGQIVYRHYNPDYSDRPDVEEILNAL